MSDMNLIYTTQTKTLATGQPSALGNGNLLGNGTGVFGIGSGSFFDLIFSNLENTKKEKTEKYSPLSLLFIPQTAPASPQVESDLLPVLQESIISDFDVQTEVGTSINAEIPVAVIHDTDSQNIDLPDITALNAPILESTSSDISIAPATDNQSSELVPVSPVFPALNITASKLDLAGQKKLVATLENLLQGLPPEQRPVIVNMQPGQLKKVMEQLKIKSASIQEESQSLIATGLTPEQLNKLVTLIGKGSSEDDKTDDSTDVAAFLIGIVKIMPDSSGKEAIFIPRALFLSKPEESSTNEIQKIPGQLSSSLNALSIEKSAGAKIPLTDGEIVSPGVREPGFGDVLESLGHVPSKGTEIKISVPSDSLPKNATGTPGPVNSTLGSGLSGMIGSLMNTTSLNDLFPDGMDWSQSQIAGLNNTHMSNPIQLTSLVTQAQQATHPHPTTQMIAATLTRAAKSGEDQTLRLQLDPPELGRIEVHMHFTKDKAMKAHMVIEKPETMLMMQRDSQTLERALHDSGIDMSGNSLSFELSGHDQSFNGNHNTGGNSGAGQNINLFGTDGSDSIETTMTWYVDSKTGQQHYNILA